MNTSTTQINTPLIMYQPLNVLTFAVLYSPVITALSIFSLSFIFQNLKGLLYLGWLIISLCIRGLVVFLAQMAGVKMDPLALAPKGGICTAVQYAPTVQSNAGFSMFVIAFTYAYICSPMFMNNSINYSLFAAYLVYLLMDIFVRRMIGCAVSWSNVAVNILSGVMLGVSAVFIVSAIPSGTNYLFFNEMGTGKEVCSMASKKTFKCAVYKNGELISSI